MKNGIVFRHGSHEFHLDAERRVNLTAIWRAAGSPVNRDPRQWRRKEGADFIRSLAAHLAVPVGHTVRATSGGKGGGGETYGHWQIAVAYTQYLSPDYHRLTIEAFRQWCEEYANPDLKVDRAYEGHRRNGLDPKEACDRIQSRAQRNLFTAQLCEAGVTGSGYPLATNRIYRGLYNSDAKGLRESRGLPPNANLRDNFDPAELAAVRLSEAIAGQGINQAGVRGNEACAEVCEIAGESVRAASEAFAAKMLSRGYGDDGASLTRRSG